LQNVNTLVTENESVKYIEPKMIITYNLSETLINQDCEMFNKTIRGNNILQLSQCTLEVRDIQITTSKNIKLYYGPKDFSFQRPFFLFKY